MWDFCLCIYFTTSLSQSIELLLSSYHIWPTYFNMLLFLIRATPHFCRLQLHGSSWCFTLPPSTSNTSTVSWKREPSLPLPQTVLREGVWAMHAQKAGLPDLLLWQKASLWQSPLPAATPSAENDILKSPLAWWCYFMGKALRDVTPS